MYNIFSIDLESWVHFYLSALKIHPDTLSSLDKKKLDNNYIPDATLFLLDLLDKYKQKASFFILGEIYTWYPEIIRTIAKRGHEIAYHSHTHKIIQNKETLREELKKSKSFIDEFGPIGFRAPDIYITRDSMAQLKECDFRYSSSTYNNYGIRNYDGIDEIPVSAISFRGRNRFDQNLPKNLTVQMLFRQIPFGSGLFISLLRSKTSYFIERLNKKKEPAILFIHPWQIYMPKEMMSSLFRLKVLARNPFCFPYTMNIRKPLEELMKRHVFLSFKRFYYE